MPSRNGRRVSKYVYAYCVMPLPNDQVSAGAVADAHSLIPHETDHLNRKDWFVFASAKLTDAFFGTISIVLE